MQQGGNIQIRSQWPNKAYLCCFRVFLGTEEDPYKVLLVNELTISVYPALSQAEPLTSGRLPGQP